MTTVTIYSANGRFVPAPVKVQKFPADLSQTREVKFSPLVIGGTDAAAVTAQIVSRDTFVAWLAEEDAEARAAILAKSATDNPDWSPKEHKTGTVSPTREQIALMRELLDMPTAARLASAGIVIRVSTRGDDSAAGKAGKAKETEEEKAARAFALMFPEPVEETDPAENALDATEPSDPEPEESVAVPAAGGKGK